MNKGFAQILLIIVAVLVGIGGYLAYKDRSVKLSPSETFLPPTPLPIQKAELEVYVLKNSGFSLQLPEEFVADERPESSSVDFYLSSNDLEKNKNCPPLGPDVVEPFPCAPPVLGITLSRKDKGSYQAITDFVDQELDEVETVVFKVFKWKDNTWALTPPIGLDNRPTVQAYVIKDNYIYEIHFNVWVASFLKFQGASGASNNNWNELSGNEVALLFEKLDSTELETFVHQTIDSLEFIN